MMNAWKEGELRKDYKDAHRAGDKRDHLFVARRET